MTMYFSLAATAFADCFSLKQEYKHLRNAVIIGRKMLLHPSAYFDGRDNGLNESGHSLIGELISVEWIILG